MKKMWKENRVLFMLMIILVICFIAIVVVALTFFYSKDVDSYGSRLKDIDKYPFKEKAKNAYEDKLLENEGVKKVSLNTKGRVIYVHVSFDETIDLEDAKLIVSKSLEHLNPKLNGQILFMHAIHIPFYFLFCFYCSICFHNFSLST